MDNSTIVALGNGAQPAPGPPTGTLALRHSVPRSTSRTLEQTGWQARYVRASAAHSSNRWPNNISDLGANRTVIVSYVIGGLLLRRAPASMVTRSCSSSHHWSSASENVAGGQTVRRRALRSRLVVPRERVAGNLLYTTHK